MQTYSVLPSIKLSKKTLSVTTLVFGLLFSSTIFASGSESFGGAETGASQLYNTGKMIVATKVTCNSCPLAGKKLDKNSAMELLQNTGMGAKAKSMLSASKKEALDAYLKRRYNL